MDLPSEAGSGRGRRRCRSLRQPGGGYPVRGRGHPGDPRLGRARISPELVRARNGQGPGRNGPALTMFIAIGILALIVGGTMLVTGIRRHQAQQPRHVAMLIAGMMIAAFGLLLGGFAIAYTAAGPLDAA